MSIHEGRYRHGLSRMLGRDSAETGRTATPLELLYDLTFVAAFGVAAAELAHGIVDGHAGPAVVAFSFSIVAVVWAWTYFTWLASAFDDDDWLIRLLTLVQMAGVLVLAIGIPPLFASIERGGTVDTGVALAGYIVIRVAVSVQWVRVARANPRYRRVGIIYAVFVLAAQVGWVALALVHVTVVPALVTIVVLIAVESIGPIVAESRGASSGAATPWNPHHLAERYSLLTIIALGETVVGTLASASRISSEQGWTADAVAAIATGVALSFALWWIYFLVPHAAGLDARRGRALPWAYLHIVLFGAIAATGAGLHVVGYAFDPHHPVAARTAVFAVALPVLLFMLTRFALHVLLTSSAPRPVALHLVTFALPIAAIALGYAGSPLWVCLLVTLAAPVTLIVAFEAGGWRSLDAQLARTATLRR